MVDGLPIERVQRSNRFWLLVQERYAKLFGMRVLRDVKQRKDTGKPQQFRKRNGKHTVTAVKRARIAALQKEASPHQRNVPASDVRNVFGVMPTTDEQLSELRKQEKTKTFEQLVERAKRKEEQTIAEHSRLLPTTSGLPRGGSGYRLCSISALKLAAANKKQQKKAGVGKGIMFLRRALAVRDSYVSLCGQRWRPNRFC